MHNNYASLARRTRFFVLSSYCGLLLVFTLNTLLWPGCNKPAGTVIWLMHMVPVLLFLPGLIKARVRTHVWLSFISLGYFLAAVPAVFICFKPLPVVETVLIVQLFISAMLYVRWRSRELAAINGSATE